MKIIHRTKLRHETRIHRRGGRADALRISAMLFALLLVSAAGAAPAYAQSGETGAGACDLVDTAALEAALPDPFYDYEVEELAVAPPAGEAPGESVTLSALYTAESGDELRITVSHYCPGRRAAESGADWDARVERREAMVTEYRGHTAYMQMEHPAGAVHVGEDFELAVHASPGTPWGDVEEAVEMARIDALEALVTRAESEQATATAEEAPGLQTAMASRSGGSGEDEPGCSFNEELRGELPEALGAGEAELWPWAHPLAPEQVAAAEISEGAIAFPKQGNEWLGCVERNDILWSPQARDPRRQFLRRVLEITEESERFVFRTRAAGLHELFQRASIRMESVDSSRD